MFFKNYFRNLTTETLRYLSPDQALTDIAHFIPYVKSKYISNNDKDAPVILFGFNYGGSLVTWFRQKYPHLVDGAWASSTPLIAKVDNFGYNEIIGETYRQIGGSECYHHIEDGFEAMEIMVAENKSAELSKSLGLCQDMGIGLNLATFFSLFSHLFALEVQNTPK